MSARVKRKMFAALEVMTLGSVSQYSRREGSVSVYSRKDSDKSNTNKSDQNSKSPENQAKT